MALPRLVLVAAALAAASALAACHVDGHLPPGQLKHIVDPPPGHGGTPPGQERKGG